MTKAGSGIQLLNDTFSVPVRCSVDVGSRQQNPTDQLFHMICLHSGSNISMHPFFNIQSSDEPSIAGVHLIARANACFKAERKFVLVVQQVWKKDDALMVHQ